MDEMKLNEEIEKLTDDPVDRLLQERKPVSSGKSIAILALLVAFAAVSATGWQWWLTQSANPQAASQQESIVRLQDAQQVLSDSVSSFESQLDAVELPVDAAELSSRQQRLAAVEQQIADINGQSAQDTASVSAVQGSVRSIEQRLSAVESGLISVAASSQNSSVELDVAEIDFLLRAASERLHLFSDPVAADLALQAADVQMEALNDPMFLSVRQRIASSRQALAALPKIDRVQLSSQLTSLQENIAELPFRGEVESAPLPELPEDAGWWASFKHTLASLVTVKRRVPEDQSLLSLDDKDYLRQGLWLQIESTRLALMRNDSSVYIGSLNRVDDTVEQFFENGSSEVQALLLEVEALKQINIAPQMPDISGPWTQLRQLRDSRRLLQSATPVEEAGKVE
jgi:uroporphyrin-3 C-methyltransferase